MKKIMSNTEYTIQTNFNNKVTVKESEFTDRLKFKNSKASQINLYTADIEHFQYSSGNKEDTIYLDMLGDKNCSDTVSIKLDTRDSKYIDLTVGKVNIRLQNLNGIFKIQGDTNKMIHQDQED